MKALKSIIHFLMAVTLTLTNMNLGVFSSLIAYASEENTMTSFEQPIPELDEIFSEESINLVNPGMDSQLSQAIRQKKRDLEQQNLEEQEETMKSEVNLEEQEETMKSEVNLEEQEETTKSEVNLEEQEETTKSEVNLEEQEETTKSEVNLEEQEETTKSEVNLEEQEMNKQNLVQSRSAKIIGVEADGTTVNFDELSVAWDMMAGGSTNNQKTVTIKFQNDYTITETDARSLLTTSITASKVIITAAPDVTVTVDRDLEFYENYLMSPSNAPAHIPDRTLRTIRFENIKLEFTGNYKIALNSLALEMGTGVEMIKDKYPTILLGNLNGATDLMHWVSNEEQFVSIESGHYNEIIMGSDKDSGKKLIDTRPIPIYLKGGTVEKIIYGNNSSTQSPCTVEITGGEINHIEDLGKGFMDQLQKNHLTLYIKTETTIQTVKDVAEVYIGDFGGIVGSLTITNLFQIKSLAGTRSTFAVYPNSSFILTETAKPVYLYSLNVSFYDNSNILLPANRDKSNVPMIFDYLTIWSLRNVHFGASNTVTEDEFYFLLVTATQIDTNWIGLDDDEEFYIEQIEEDKGKTPNVSVDIDFYYMKAKKKITGPLIYDFNQDKLLYVDSNGNEQEAWWFSEKISNSQASLDNLTYENLSKNGSASYEILSPQPLTLKIRGSGSNKTFKFNNEKSTNRQINIEFDNLTLTDSELKFLNINSIKLNGTSAVTQTSSSNSIKALTYSFAQSNNTSRITRSNDGKFLVYSNDSLGNYSIEAQIINETATDITNNSSISQLSFEDVSSDKAFNFSSVESNRVYAAFSSKASYKNLSILLPTDSEKFILCEGNGSTKCQPEEAYYYQSASITGGVNQNSGPIGTRITFTDTSPHNYYEVSNKSRVYVKATKLGDQYYYLDDTLKDAMQQHVAHIDGTHEVIFLGNYNINTDEDVNAVEQYNKNTNGITFMTEVDDIKYILNISKDLIFEKYASNRNYLVTFDQIKWQFNSDNLKIYADGRSLTFGPDIQMSGNNYPTIMGGHPTSTSLISNATITIQSGMYKDVIGHHDNIANGSSVTINISAGNFTGKVNGTNTTNGNSTIEITGGTFNDQIIGASGTSQGNVTMNLSGGTFNDQIIGASGTSQGNVTMNLSGGTFNDQIIGAEEQASGTATLNISNGTFSNNVIGVTGQSTSPLTMTISGGTFTGIVYGNRQGNSSQISLIIKGGTFNDNVYGETEGTNSLASVTVLIQDGVFNRPFIGANTAQTVTVDITGGTFAQPIAATMGSSDATMTISGGTFTGIVYGANSQTSSFPSSIDLNITGGTFNNSLIGLNQNDATPTVTINIDGTVTIPTIRGYDLLNIGKSTSSSQLKITNALLTVENGPHEEKVKLQNQSTLHLSGNSQSTVKILEVSGSGNVLKLNLVRKGTAPLSVKNSYSVSSGDKLKLEVEGNKMDDAWLINFYSTDIHIEDFEFTDNDYYIRDIFDATNNNEKKLTLYEKMENPSFNWNLTDNQLTVSVNGSTTTPWWLTTLDLTQDTVDLDIINLLQYKGTTIFKDPLTVNLVLSGTSTDRNISLQSTIQSFNVTLNTVNLTDSTLSLTNLNQLGLEGQNMMTSLNSTSPIFSYSFDGNGEVSATDNQSNLVVYSSNQDSISATNSQGGNIGKVLSLSFDERDDYSGLDLADQIVRLVDNNNNELNYTIPQNTKNMSLLFANNASSQYHLYHGATSTTGSSVYVAGTTEDTFTDTFEIKSNNQVVTYQNVRRAKPVKTINTSTQIDISFELNLGLSSMNTITPDNWGQYFSSKPLTIEVLDGSRSVVDVYTDSSGTTHYFGETPLTIKTTYEGLELNGNSASLELVSPSDLDPNLILQTLGAKMALNLVDNKYSNYHIPLVQGVPVATQYSWDLEPNKPLVLDLEPNFDGNDYFFNADLIATKYQTNHYLKFTFDVITPTP